MFEIKEKIVLNRQTVQMELEAPSIAQSCQAGQFIIFRIDAFGERIPLTICDAHPERGTIRIVFQTVGKSTAQLGDLQVGDRLLDVVGPLGRPTELEGYQRVCIVVGGLGSAIGLMSAKQLHRKGAQVDLVAGFQTNDLVILEDELRACAEHFYLCTDDGSAGFHGFVTEQLQALCKSQDYDLVLTIGPLPMMKAVAAVTKANGLKTMASMNPIMMDGSGMCGCCRVSVAGKLRFACVDGPDFDAHQVDFDELMIRNRFYRLEEQQAYAHYCNLTKEKRAYE